jgi:hypothetical protein
MGRPCSLVHSLSTNVVALASIMKGLRYFSLAVLPLLRSVDAVTPLVDLGYSKYKGKELSNGVTQWLGVRYAAPPLGDLRFSPPQDPTRNDTIQDASNVSHCNSQLPNPW